MDRYRFDMNHSIDFRQLRYFVAVAEELHFGRAATKLCIAQPALSQQIQRLERKLGTALFTRTSRNVTLTDAGSVLLEEARHILAAVRRAVTATQRTGRGETGRLTAAFAASVMFLTLPRIIREFRECFPDVVLELRELPTAVQLSALHTGEIDVGFVRQPPPDERLHLETVLREFLVVAVDRSHRLAEQPKVDPEELADERFVLFPREVGPGLYSQVLTICREAGFTPNVVQESRELYTTVSLVEAGVGITIVPASMRKMGWTGVMYKDLATVMAETRIDMAWHVDNSRPVVQSFLELVRGMIRDNGNAP